MSCRRTLAVWMLVACAATSELAIAGDLLLWNRFESEANVEVSDIGPGFQLTSYIYDDWDEARIEPAMFGNGLYVNHDTNEGWSNDGANFFALDLWDTGLTPQRGTIEFWFQFKYDSSVSNFAYLFFTSPDLTGHLPGPPVYTNVWMAAHWHGWGGYKAFGIRLGPDATASTPLGSAGPGGHLEFGIDTLRHFAYVWDVDGIEGSPDTLRIYLDGNLEASDTAIWDASLPFERYLYLGSPPSHDPWDHNYNALKGVTDNLVVRDFAKTDFSDRFIEDPTGSGQVPASSTPGMVLLGAILLLAVLAFVIRRSPVRIGS